MKFDEAIALVDYLNNRMLPCSWYKWSVKITWEKLQKWEKFFKDEKPKQSH